MIVGRPGCWVLLWFVYSHACTKDSDCSGLGKCGALFSRKGSDDDDNPLKHRNSSSGSCCVSISSDGTCVGQESGDNPSDDDDMFHGHEPEVQKQYDAFREAGGWSSFSFAGTFLAVQVYWMPENRSQMRPRMLLILLGFDAFAGLFFGLEDAPTFFLSDKYNGNISVNSIFAFLG